MDVTNVEARVKEGEKNLQAAYEKATGKKYPSQLVPGLVSAEVPFNTVADLVEPGKLEVTIGAYIRDALVAPDSNGERFYERFVKSFLKEALEDPSGYCGRQLSSGIINEKMFKALDSQTNKSKEDDMDFARFKLRGTLYKEQQEVFDDIYDRTIMMICSRRAGKTFLNAALIVNALLRGFPVLYLNKTIGNAIAQTFDLVEELLKKTPLKIESKSRVDGEIVLTDYDIKNNMKLNVRWAGMNDLASLDKLRGFHFGLVIIDECGHIKNGDYLLNEVVTPMTSDYEKSQIILSGTPPRVKGFATRLWHSKIRKFHWTAEVNPFIPDFRSFIDRVCIEKGYVKEEKGTDRNTITVPDYSIPFIQREYFGNMDAFDTDAIVFKNYKTYDNKKTEYGKEDPFIPDHIYIGIDWGFYDHFAMVSFYYDSISKKARIIRCIAKGKLGVEDKKVLIRKEYLDSISDMSNRGYDNAVVLISDTNQPDLMLDLWKEGIPIYKAFKSDMMESIEELASHLRTGSIKVPSSWVDSYKKKENRNEEIKDEEELIADLDKTVYARDDNDNLIPEIADDVYHPNAIHALRYASRYAFNGLNGGSAGELSDFGISQQLKQISGKIKEENNTAFDYSNMTSNAFDD